MEGGGDRDHANYGVHAAPRTPLPLQCELIGASETTTEGESRIGGGSHAALVMELRNDTASGPRINDRWHWVYKASRNATTVAISASSSRPYILMD